MASAKPVARADEGDEAALLAEIARLKADLARAAARIADLELHADIDPLTEVRNRQGFERELKRSLSYVTRYGTAAALVYIDLDGFKAINDRHGHAAGDTVLRGVAATLVRHVRGSDVVGRLGGDEFAILMWNVDAAQARAKAAQLGTAIAAARFEHEADGVATALAVGASSGVAALDPSAGFSQVLDAADKAMYEQKRTRQPRR